jgi:hypothetical protein
VSVGRDSDYEAWRRSDHINNLFMESKDEQTDRRTQADKGV